MPCRGLLSFRGACSGSRDEASTDAKGEYQPRASSPSTLDRAPVNQDLHFVFPYCSALLPGTPSYSLPFIPTDFFFSQESCCHCCFHMNLISVYIDGRKYKWTCRFTTMCATVLRKQSIVDHLNAQMLSNAYIKYCIFTCKYG